MLKKSNRIQNQRLILKLGREGRAYKTKNFVFKFLASDLPDSKFAISVSKKISNKAVRRNKIRRQVAESLRKHIEKIKAPIVCLIIQKKGTPDKIEYTIIDTEITEFINQLEQ